MQDQAGRSDVPGVTASSPMHSTAVFLCRSNGSYAPHVSFDLSSSEEHWKQRIAWPAVSGDGRLIRSISRIRLAHRVWVGEAAGARSLPTRSEVRQDEQQQRKLQLASHPVPLVRLLAASGDGSLCEVKVQV